MPYSYGLPTLRDIEEPSGKPVVSHKNFKGLAGGGLIARGKRGGDYLLENRGVVG